MASGMFLAIAHVFVAVIASVLYHAFTKTKCIGFLPLMLHWFCEQEDAAPEIAEMIAEFVKSLPSSMRQDIDSGTLPDNGELFYEMAKNSDNSPRSSHFHGRYHRHRHSHEQERGYMEGVGQAAGVGHGGWVI